MGNKETWIPPDTKLRYAMLEPDIIDHYGLS